LLIKNYKYIITQFTGGLGNQLFQYAIARAIAKKSGLILKLDTSFFSDYKWHVYSLNPFNIIHDYIDEEELKEFLQHRESYLQKLKRKIGFKYSLPEIYEEKTPNFDKNVLEINKSTYLKGYWQTEKYFKEIESDIKSDFSIKIPATAENVMLKANIDANNSVSLHVRRGNYVTEKVFNEFHGTCSLDYYKKAIEYIGTKVANPRFYVFSNDIPWCRKELQIDADFYFVDINDDKTDYEDLRLLQSCQHHIIANSTFSWWGAWLCENPDKIVIAPKQWFADEAMNALTGDLIPEGWIRM
jgi:hypothetical protein